MDKHQKKFMVVEDMKGMYYGGKSEVLLEEGGNLKSTGGFGVWKSKVYRGYGRETE